MSNIQVKLTGTTKIIGAHQLKFPVSVSFRSADAGRKIELSLDNGVEWFLAPYAFTSATALVAAVMAPADIKVTGVANDTLTITMGEA